MLLPIFFRRIYGFGSRGATDAKNSVCVGECPGQKGDWKKMKLADNAGKMVAIVNLDIIKKAPR